MQISEPSAPIRLAGIIAESVVDGPGFRMTIFVQGCPHRCYGCHNPETHDPAGGYDGNLDELFDTFRKNSLLAGVTFSGGEPFMYPAQLAEFARRVHETGKNVWVYSGYTFEELLERAKTDPPTLALLRETDVLVDGPYIQQQRSLMLKFRGSGNQRVLNMKKSLENGRAEAYNINE